MFYRVYFNAHADFPYVWSIDTGDDTEELNVKSIKIEQWMKRQCEVVSNYRPERQPKAWFEVYGNLVISDGHAIIEAY